MILGIEDDECGWQRKEAIELGSDVSGETVPAYTVQRARANERVRHKQPTANQLGEELTSSLNIGQSDALEARVDRSTWPVCPGVSIHRTAMNVNDVVLLILVQTQLSTAVASCAGCCEIPADIIEPRLCQCWRQLLLHGWYSWLNRQNLEKTQRPVCAWCFWSLIIKYSFPCILLLAIVNSSRLIPFLYSPSSVFISSRPLFFVPS
jgi:hypothetical protein